MVAMVIAGWMQVGFGQNLQSGLVAHYKLNGNARDTSPYANHGSLRAGDFVLDDGQYALPAGPGVVRIPSKEHLTLNETGSFSFQMKFTNSDPKEFSHFFIKGLLRNYWNYGLYLATDR